MSINTVWENIKKNEGEPFHIKTGIEFVYKVIGDSVQPMPVNGSKIFPITQTVIEECMQLMPL